MMLIRIYFKDFKLLDPGDLVSTSVYQILKKKIA